MYDAVALDVGVRGHGLVEKFDERGRKRDEVPFTNALMHAGLEYLRHVVRSVLMPGEASGDREGYPPYVRNLTDLVDLSTTGGSPFTYLALTDHADALTAPDEWEIKGNLIGWANKTEYSGADLLRGTPNYVASIARRDGMSWVYDWPTQAANGSINSIVWAYLNQADLDAGRGARCAAELGSFSVTGPSDANSNDMQGVTHAGGSVFWIGDSDVTKYLRPYRMGPTALTFVPGEGFSQQAVLGWAVRDVAYDYATGKLFVIESGGTGVKRVTTAGVVEETGTLPANCIGCDSDGTWLWCLGDANKTLYKLSLADLSTVVETIDISAHLTSTTYRGLVCDPVGPSLLIVSNDQIGASASEDAFVRVSYAGVLLNRQSYMDQTYAAQGFARMNESGSAFVGLGPGTRNLFGYVMDGAEPRISQSRGIGARALLPETVTKDNTETLRVTYQFDFS